MAKMRIVRGTELLSEWAAPIRKHVHIVAALCVPMGAGAVGVNGFVPTDTNVRKPWDDSPTQVWRQVGRCAASAVQISPRWVLSANHAHCTAGESFYSQEGAVVPIDLEAPTQAGQTPLSTFDLHLARLSSPLPYAGNFVPLVEAFRTNWNATGLCRGLDLLLAGYGQLNSIRALRVGWAQVSAGSFQFAPGFYGVSADPRSAGNAIPTDGDSGGGVFLFGADVQEGALAGLMQKAAIGFDTSQGFPSAVRAQIDAVLADPVLNPSGEHVNWLDARTIGQTVVRPMPPLMMDAGDVTDTPAVPKYGLVTSNFGTNLQIRIPRSKSCTDGKTPVSSDGGYRVRLIRADADPDASPLIYDVSPDTPNFMIPSGITAGDWWLTVTARQYHDAVQAVTESVSAGRIPIHIPQQKPAALDHVEVNFERVDLGDGQLHWNATFRGIAGAVGPRPDGILWVSGSPYVYARSSDLGDTDPWIVSDNSKRPVGYQPGDVFTVYAYPYIGAAIGPVTPIHVTVPASLP